MSTHENAPGGNGGVSNFSGIIDESTSDHRHMRAVTGYAVLVEAGGGKSRRRLLLSLASAERAVDRARERGHFAHLVLVRLVPVEVVA